MQWLYMMNCLTIASSAIQGTKGDSLRPRQNGCYNTDDIFKCIFLKENVWIPTKISLKFVPEGPINNIPSLVQIMAWRRPGDKPLSEPMMVSSLMHICVTRPQWVKCLMRVIIWALSNFICETNRLLWHLCRKPINIFNFFAAGVAIYIYKIDNHYSRLGYKILWTDELNWNRFDKDFFVYKSSGIADYAYTCLYMPFCTWLGI